MSRPTPHFSPTAEQLAEALNGIGAAKAAEIIAGRIDGSIETESQTVELTPKLEPGDTLRRWKR